MKHVQKILSISPLMLVGFMLFSGVAMAAVYDPPDTDLPEGSVEVLLINIINYGAGLIVILAVLVIVIAGIMWTTAGGSEDQQGTARKMLIGGIIGLIIGLAAYAIVNTVVSALF